MGDNVKRKCLKCGSCPREDPDIKLYRFPNPGRTNSYRCETWARFCFSEGPWYSLDFQKKLYSEHRMLCYRHFEKASFANFAEKNLYRKAVPNIANIENQPPIDLSLTTEHPGTSHFPTNVLPRMLQRTAFANIQMVNIEMCDTADIPNKLKDEPQPGPSGVSNKKIALEKVLDPKSVPRKDNIYKRCRVYMKKVNKLQNKIKNIKSKNILNVLNDNEAVQGLIKQLTPSLALILQGELKNVKRKYVARRWTTDQKILALRLYKKSPSTYQLLRRLWCLPAPSTLKLILRQFQLNVGYNEKIFQNLNEHSKMQDAVNNEYVLMFDEMSIKKHLFYNVKEDKIEGYQDHGNHGRSPQEVTHALVFMIGGIRKKLKQPVAYYLSGSNVTADRLSVLIKEVLQKCFENNLNIAAIVCDMGGVNRRSLTILGASKEAPYFMFHGQEVVTIFDPPHLLKCFRNMFMKYNIKCYTNITSHNVTGEGVAKWAHIENFFKLDNSDGNFVFAPKLKEAHMCPNTKQKMRVNLAAQVLSHSVAAGMFARISQGLLPGEATVTADVVANMDKLFDCLNSDTPDRKKGKPHCTNMTDKSAHIQHLEKMYDFFENCSFVGCHSSPPSKQGWIWTIKGMLRLYNNLKTKYKIKALCTRRLQQDPLENLFGTIRSNCGANYNPTSGQFVAGLKTAILSNLAQMGSGNCAADDCSSISNYNELLTRNTCTESVSPLVSDMLSLAESSFQESVCDAQKLQACAYVCGFMLRNLGSECTLCNSILKIKHSDNIQLYTFMEFKEYDNIKKNLNYASEDFIRCVENCATICNIFYEKLSYSLNLKKQVIRKLTEEVDFGFLANCEEHFKQNVTFICNSVFHITIKRFCIVKNRQFADNLKGLKRKIDIVKNK